jgi:hypothetical protein
VTPPAGDPPPVNAAALPTSPSRGEDIHYRFASIAFAAVLSKLDTLIPSDIRSPLGYSRKYLADDPAFGKLVRRNGTLLL